MKRLLLASFFFVSACGDGDTGTVGLTLNRVGDPANLTVNNNGADFQIVLSEAQISFAAINLVDVDIDEETPTFDGVTNFDFIAQSALVIPSIEIEPTTFEELHVIPGDAVEGAQIGTALHLVFVVTLSDATTANVTVDLTLGAGDEEQILAAAVDVAAGDEKQVALALDLVGLLDGIDYDTLSASVGVGNTITIEDGTGNADLDNAVALMVENILTSFAFVSAQ